jgi:iron complex transport system permease protein
MTPAARLTSLTPARCAWSLAACTLLLLLLLVISPGIGSEFGTVSWWDAWRAQLGVDIPRSELLGHPFGDTDDDGQVTDEELASFIEFSRRIGFQLRFPRALLALQVGATLALCGAVFQILFRNPLATPYTLGLASGGSLGALVAIRFGWTVAFLGLSSTTLSAFAGAITVVGVVLLMVRGGRQLTSNELLLAGVTMGLFCSSMMMLITFISTQRETFALVRWMMGSLDTITVIEGARMFPLVLPAWIVLILSARALNQYRLGDELAITRGVNIVRLQVLCVLVCTLATAAVVAQCGPIGFVGLVVPHMVGLVFGSDCRILLPASALLGAAFTILCDWASQLAMPLAGAITGQRLGGAVLPIGVVTAVIGVPIFLVLLRARRT